MPADQCRRGRGGRFVQSAEFNHSGAAKPVLHGGCHKLAGRDHDRKRDADGRAAVEHVISAFRLKRDSEAQFPHERPGPDPGGDDRRGALETSLAGFHRPDPTSRQVEIQNVGTDDAAAGALHGPCQVLDVLSRTPHETVVAHDCQELHLGGDVRHHLADRSPFDLLGHESRIPAEGPDIAVVFEMPAGGIGKGVMRVLKPVRRPGVACQVPVLLHRIRHDAGQRAGDSPGVPVIGVEHVAREPRGDRRQPSPDDEEREIRIKGKERGLCRQTRPGHRCHGAGRQNPRISERGPFTGRLPIDQHDIGTGPLQPNRGRYARDAGTDHDHGAG